MLQRLLAAAYLPEAGRGTAPPHSVDHTAIHASKPPQPVQHLENLVTGQDLNLQGGLDVVSQIAQHGRLAGRQAVEVIVRIHDPLSSHPPIRELIFGMIHGLSRGSLSERSQGEL
jgi:hypothetical protein